ncbi:MAG TPA: dihydrodipicolinate reductase C-terminal domain-containing protein [Candidatus Limnocylindrales bacterium]|jgi:4-hydroxy-tetrahydrodipicolinate reductase
MNIAIFGNGRLGSEIGELLGARSGIRPTILGRPASGRHSADALTGVDLVFDASVGAAVRDNVDLALSAGVRRFVIATTAWADDEPAIEAALRRASAVAVVAPNFSIGVNLFFRLVDAAVRLYGPIGTFDPYVLEWHHAAKADRPSGTARELLRRIVAAHPRKRGARELDADGPADPGLVEVAVLRAGAGPGMHLVGFDAPGETLELRLTARDRSAYAAGAATAADWLMAEPRSPGIHPFDEVVDDLLAVPQPIAIPA